MLQHLEGSHARWEPRREDSRNADHVQKLVVHLRTRRHHRRWSGVVEMMQLSLSFEDLKDSGCGCSQIRSKSHLQLRHDANKGNNSRLVFTESDAKTVTNICGDSGLLINLLPANKAAIIAKGGKRRFHYNKRQWCISVADKAITEKMCDMFGMEVANIGFTLDTIKLMDGMLAIYIQFESTEVN